MLKVVYFNYASIILLLAILVTALFKKMSRGRDNLCFLLVAVEILLTAISGSVAISLDNAGYGHLVLKMIFHTAYLLFHDLTAFVYLAYLISLTDTWHKYSKNNLKKILLVLPGIFVILFLAINVFYPFMFYFDENTVYTRNKSFVILYILAFYYLTYGVIHVIYHHNLFSRKITVTAFSLYPITIVSVIIEAIFPNIVIETFTNAICLIFILNIIHHPEELLNNDTGFRNGIAFSSDMEKTFINDKEIKLIIINVTNYRTLRNIIGYVRRPKLSTEIARRIKEISDRYKLSARMYYLKNGQFRLVVEKKYFANVESAAEKMNRVANMPFEVDNIEINLIANICVANIPDEIDNFDSLMIFSEDLRKTKYFTQKVLKASDIFDKQYYEKVSDINEIIERGFVNNNFFVCYQPIYSIEEKKFKSAEALLRLNDEKYGFISPEIFIPAAERSGSIHKIGVFVLEEVCKFISSEEFKSLGIDYVEVNLSVAQCMKDNLAKIVLSILKKYGVTSDKINLEITETALSQSQEKLLRNLNTLVKSGLNISLDDFGSGYSNLQRISQLPFEIVKLDKSFITEGDSEKIFIILENIINMVRALNIKIVIEGVETEEVLERFINLKCDYVQGFYFSKPLKQNEFVQFVKNHN